MRLLPEASKTLSSQGVELDKNDFRLLANLGRGSFGKVYKVSHIPTGHEYAIKIVCKEKTKTESMIKQIQTEVGVMERVDHPGIVKLYTYFENDANIYLVLELGGDNLYTVLLKEKRFAESKAKVAVSQTLEAMAYLHAMTPPVIHRDLKPENLLVFGERIKLADFGWAGMQDNPRKTFCGTPDYLSPEMIRRQGHTEKIDVWAIGILTYELLVGKAPFSPEGIKDKHDKLKVMEARILVALILLSKDNWSSLQD